jgi:hypothetical protein
MTSHNRSPHNRTKTKRYAKRVDAKLRHGDKRGARHLLRKLERHIGRS